MLNKTSLLAIGFLSSFPARAASDRELFLLNMERITSVDAELKSVEETRKAEYSDIRALQNSWLPAVKARVDGMWKDSTKEGLSTDEHRANLVVESKVNVFAFGRDRLSWNLGESRQESLELFLGSAQIDAEKRAAFHLLAYAESQRQLNVATQVESNRQRIADVALNRFQRGLLSEIDYKKISIDLELAQLTRLEKATAFEAKKDLILRKLGILPDKVGLLLDSGRETLDSLLKKMNQDSQGRNFQLRLAESLVREKELQCAMTFRKYLPSLDLTGDRYLGLSGLEKSLTETVWTLSLSVPLYDRGLTRSENQQVQHSFAAAEAERDNIKQASELRSEEILQQLRLQGRSLVLKYGILQTTQNIHENSVLRFAQATISVNDLSQDEDRLLRVEDEYTATLFQLNRSLIEYCQIKGLRLRHCFGN